VTRRRDLRGSLLRYGRSDRSWGQGSIDTSSVHGTIEERQREVDGVLWARELLLGAPRGAHMANTVWSSNGSSLGKRAKPTGFGGLRPEGGWFSTFCAKKTYTRRSLVLLTLVLRCMNMVRGDQGFTRGEQARCSTSAFNLDSWILNFHGGMGCGV